jgi:type IV pilus assembly protein PilA
MSSDVLGRCGKLAAIIFGHDWGRWRMSDAWYYVDGNEQVGPVPREQLLKFLLSPGGDRHTLVWRNGLSDWKAAGEVGELGAEFEGPAAVPRRDPQPAATPMAASPRQIR